MAACSIGPSGLKITNLDLGRPKLSTLQPLLGFGTLNSIRFDDLVLFRKSKKALTRRRSCNSAPTTANTGDCSEETESSEAVSKLIPKSSELEYLLTELCGTTSIAQFELKLRGFRLNVTRELPEQSAPPQPPVSSPHTAHTVFVTPDSNGSILSQSTALVLSAGGVQELLDTAADEGLLMLRSPRVGIFRRSRRIKKKKLPPACKESSAAGEVVKILLNDGDPVGYDDAIIALLPSFPGTKKLQ